MYVDRDHARADESVDDLHARFQAGALELGETAIRPCPRLRAGSRTISIS